MRYWIFILAALTLLLASCNNTIPVGPEILPDGDSQGNTFTDTTTLYTSTVREDSLRSDKMFLSQLGYMEDPVFGSTKSTLMMGFRVPNGAVSPSIFDTVGGFGLDSCVLSLTLSSIYGDSSDFMGMKVYKLPIPLNSDDVYYSNIEFSQGMVEVGEIITYVPRIGREYTEDSTYQDLGPQLRIRLNPFFGQSLLNLLGTDQFESNELFHQVLPGLIVVPNDDNGSIIEIDMVVSTSTADRSVALQDSRLHLYYHNAIDSSLNIIFPATILNLGVSKYEHNYQGSNVESALSLNNSEGDEVNYIQGLAGVKTKVEIPYLSAYDNAAIQKAELVITQILDGFESTFSPPDRLFAVKIGDDGENINTSDIRLFTSAHSGGNATEKTLSNGDVVMEYRINISDQLQRIVFGQEENTGFYITLYGEQEIEITSLNTSNLVPDRVVIGGGKNDAEEYRLKLDLTYSKLED